MRALLPPSESVDLHAHYAADWLDAGGVRAGFLVGVDGAVSVAGVSAGLQVPGDHDVYATIRDLADVILVGAGTARAEKYGPVEFEADRAARRGALGLAPDLPIAVVTGSLDLSGLSALFEGGSRPLLVTRVAAGEHAAARDRAAQVATVIERGHGEVDLAAVLDALRDRGFRRILCEGGPTLLSQLVAVGLLDELAVTISPVLAGPGSPRLTAGTGWPAPAWLRLHSVLEQDGALFCRYRRADGTRPAD